MKFEEIKNSIFSIKNVYEENYGIRTLSVECMYKNDNCAVFIGRKSDGTTTVFYARKGKRKDENSWMWFCPSEIEIEKGFPTLIDIYRIFNRKNKKLRGGV